MKQFEDFVERFREGNVDLINRIYWANVCDNCREWNNPACGKGMGAVQMMNRLCFSVPVELEVTDA